MPMRLRQEVNRYRLGAAIRTHHVVRLRPRRGEQEAVGSQRRPNGSPAGARNIRATDVPAGSNRRMGGAGWRSVGGVA